MKTSIIFTSIFALLSLNSCSVFGIRSGYDEVSYKDIDKVGVVEIRSYPARLVVEVSDARNRNAAFNSLFDYISGENSSKSDIQMTSPVQLDEDTSEKIAMTAPVQLQESSNEQTMMRFFLPKDFTLKNAPKPTNPKVTLKELPAETIAVLTYSGSTSHEKFLEKKAELLSLIEPSSWKVVGSVSFLGYNPPFTIPFLKRNEVVVAVEKAN